MSKPTYRQSGWIYRESGVDYRGRRKPPLTSTATLTLRARIAPPLAAKTLQMRANIWTNPTLQMRAWIYKFPSLDTMARISQKTEAPLDLRARIGHPQRDLTVRATIRKTESTTLQMRANILYHPTYASMTARARLSHRQGWPILQPDDTGYANWTDTRLYSKAYISLYYRSQTLGIQARISPQRIQHLQARASIVKAGSLSIGAFIKEARFQDNYLMYYSIRNQDQRSLTGIFSFRGRALQNSFTAQARIARALTTRFTGYFVIRDNPPSSNVVSFRFSATSEKQNILGMKANITK